MLHSVQGFSAVCEEQTPLLHMQRTAVLEIQIYGKGAANYCTPVVQSPRPLRILSFVRSNLSQSFGKVCLLPRFTRSRGLC